MVGITARIASAAKMLEKVCLQHCWSVARTVEGRDSSSTRLHFTHQLPSSDVIDEGVGMSSLYLSMKCFRRPSRLLLSS